MPKTHRDFLKRKTAHVVFNIDRAGMHLEGLLSEFKPVHPDIAVGLELAQEMLIHALKLVNTFAEVSWNMTSPDWDAWRNEPDNRRIIEDE